VPDASPLMHRRTVYRIEPAIGGPTADERSAFASYFPAQKSGVGFAPSVASES